MVTQKQRLRVLFVSSGGSNGQISPIIKNQGESLKAQGIDLYYFTINGKGLLNYLRSIFKLKKVLKQLRPDVIHAHYGLCGIVALMARKKEKIVQSFMGSDIIGAYNNKGGLTGSSKILNFINKHLAQNYYDYCIVKSEELYNRLGSNNKMKILPNGVDISKFRFIPREEACLKTGLDPFNHYILFVSNPERKEKNYPLAKEAIKSINRADLQLEVIYGRANEDLPYYYNIADALLLTSFHEGSPNVVKEAMACNCPVVSTNVGDVSWLFGDIPGHYITEQDVNVVAEKVTMASVFRQQNKMTKGNDRLIELGLDNISVSLKIKDIYCEICQK